MSRPTKRTEVVERAILASLKAGATRTAAAEAAGIHRDTLRQWIAADPTFSAALEKAEAEAELSAVKVVRSAMRKSWQAAAWWLERRRSEDFGQRQRVDINIQQLVRKRAEEEGLDPSEVLAEAEALLKAAT